MTTRTALLLALSSLLALSACGQDPSDPSGATPALEADDPELAGLSDDGADGKEDSGSSSTSTYYWLRPDVRKCAAPLCGGVWARRVNRSTTKCYDGAWQPECYVTDVDWTRLGLSARAQSTLSGAALAGKALVRGTFVKNTVAGRALAQLRATDAWQGAAATTDTVYLAKDSGARCITYPCNATSLRKINSTTSQMITGVDLTPANVSASVESQGYDALVTASLVVAGGVTVTPNAGPAGAATTLAATQLYFRAK